MPYLLQKPTLSNPHFTVIAGGQTTTPSAASEIAIFYVKNAMDVPTGSQGNAGCFCNSGKLGAVDLWKNPLALGKKLAPSLVNNVLMNFVIMAQRSSGLIRRNPY
jgi:hypothetical protein